MGTEKKVKWPFGKADQLAAAYAATIAVDVDNTKSVLTIAQMTGNATLNLTVRSEIEAGDELLIKVSADGTNRTLTPGTGMTGAAQTITANKSYLIRYVHDGSSFVHASTQLLN